MADYSPKLPAAFSGHPGRITDAALQDVQRMAMTGESLNYPDFLRNPNFAIQSVQHPSRMDAVRAAAGLARNMAVIANNNPALANELLPFVNEARNAAVNAHRGRVDPINLELATDGIREAVRMSGISAPNLDVYVNSVTQQIEQGAQSTQMEREPSTGGERAPSTPRAPSQGQGR